ncbi:MAG: CDGSH iron-sulfur domain-containing protein [Deltaproteobacteria bacterium]|nr:CDGSH iron-sulfur domain-containing protein [Deltaproteobacteria bacterium]
MTTKIKINTNGSIRIEGEALELYDGAGNKYELSGRTTISLCRCGQSENKPFCDGAHGRCGFESAVVAATLPPKK